jgi:hypothetical protein
MMPRNYFDPMPNDEDWYAVDAMMEGRRANRLQKQNQQLIEYNQAYAEQNKTLAQQNQELRRQIELLKQARDAEEADGFALARTIRRLRTEIAPQITKETVDKIYHEEKLKKS